MKPIVSHDRNQTLGPHPEEAALFARPSRRMATGTISLEAVLRDARKSALLRTRLLDDIDYDSNHGNAALASIPAVGQPGSGFNSPARDSTNVIKLLRIATFGIWRNAVMR